MSASEQHLAPYRQPGLAPVPEHFAIRDGTLVGFPLENDRTPDHCIWCNAPAESYRKLVEVGDSWFEVPLCPHHRRQHALGQPLVLLGLIAAALALPAGLFVWIWLLPAALALGLVLMVTGNAIRNRLRSGSVVNGMAWIRTCRSFASSIPSRTTTGAAG